MGRAEIARLLAGPQQPHVRDYGVRVFAQWDEDGILAFLLDTVGDVPKRFVEIGVEDYTECNTRFLLRQGDWRGVVVEADPNCARRIRGAQAPAAIRTGVGQRHLDDLIDLGRGLAAVRAAVGGAGLAPGPGGLQGGLALGEGGRLALSRAAGGLEGPQQLAHLLFEAGVLVLQDPQPRFKLVMRHISGLWLLQRPPGSCPSLAAADQRRSTRSLTSGPAR